MCQTKSLDIGKCSNKNLDLDKCIKQEFGLRQMFVVRELHPSYRERRIGRMEGISVSYPSVTRRYDLRCLL